MSCKHAYQQGVGSMEPFGTILWRQSAGGIDKHGFKWMGIYCIRTCSLFDGLKFAPCVLLNFILFLANFRYNLYVHLLHNTFAILNAPVICNHVPHPLGIVRTLTFRQENPWYNPILRGQTVGKTMAICPGSLLCCTVRSCYPCYFLKTKTPALARHCVDDAKVQNPAHFLRYLPPCPVVRIV